MIFITAKFSVRPEDADAWPEITRTFTDATRNEPGCLWFDWSRSLDDHNEYGITGSTANDNARTAEKHHRLGDWRDGAAVCAGACCVCQLGTEDIAEQSTDRVSIECFHHRPPVAPNRSVFTRCGG